VHCGAPIDVFGVGTKLAVIADAPDLDMAYKLVEYGGKGRLKLSAKKLLYPGRKQAFRQIENGHMVRDVIGRFDEPLAGEPLLKPLLLCGQPITQIELTESRRRLQSELKRLPDHLRGLQSAPTPYSVHFSEHLKADLNAIRRELGFGDT
jgi:nicotinate phosphoribosyltransferase